MSAVLTIGIDPTIQVGPFEVAWHGVMTAVGIGAGLVLASRYTREASLAVDPLYPLVAVIVAAGVMGAKLLYLLQHGPGDVLTPDAWLESGGFSIYGGIAGGALGATALLAWEGLSVRYLDALAAGLPLGMAVGRLGDLINGEHYGAPSDLPWAIVYTHPESPVPSHEIAYHPGGLYEVILSLAIFAMLWPLRHRLRRPLSLFWTTIGCYALGRFAMFFWREDTAAGLAGLNTAQLESLALVGVAVGGAAVSCKRPRPEAPPSG